MSVSTIVQQPKNPVERHIVFFIETTKPSQFSITRYF